MKLKQLSRLVMPDSPGVYIFRDYRKRPLYIGRATSLKDRVKSYFSDDVIVARGPRIVDMITKSKSVSWQKTDSVLEAIILESSLIRKYQPFYNVDDRDDKSSLYVVITDEDWPRVFLARARDFDRDLEEGKLPYAVRRRFGPYLQSGVIKEALKILRKIFPFKDKKAHDPRHEAFYRAIGRSPARPNSLPTARTAYRKTISQLILFFEGGKDRLQKRLEREMKGHVKKMEFEEAGRINKLLYALDHINDMALLKRENNRVSRQFRIEAYDIAHLAGADVVGAMVVSIGGELIGSEYKRFKVSREANDDIRNLVEIVSRRLNHPEWTYPDLIVVDGNETHVRAAEAVLRSRRIPIPVIGVTKDDRHKASRLIGNSELIDTYRKDVIAANAEAHRFAIGYHRLRRSMRYGRIKA